MAVTLSISITQNSQSVENNTSNVTVKVNASWTYGSFNRGDQSGWLKIDGTTYNFTSPFNSNESTSGSQTLFTKTVDVAHASGTGAKTLTCSASYTTGGNSGTVTATASKTLTTIARKSTLTVGNGTLGTAMTMTINKKNRGFKHRIHYTLNGTKTYILGGSNSYSSDSEVSWTPPLSIASSVTTATSTSFSVCLETFTTTNSKVGENWYSFTLTLPASIVPSVSVTVTDATGYYQKYGGMVQGQSKLSVAVTAEPAYGSSIVSYKTTANGSTYTTTSFTTGVLKAKSTDTVKATATDKRGRSAQKTAIVTVLAYNAPAIGSLSVHRCDENGNEDLQGEHVRLTFNATVTSLNSKNSSTYKVQYKKSTVAEYGEPVALTDLANSYSVKDYSYIFPAESSFSYDIKLTVEDDFQAVEKGTVVSTGYAVLHFNESGKGLAVGKISEGDVFDVGMETMLTGGLSRIELPVGTDLNAVNKANFYACLGAGQYTNAPPFKTGHTFTLEVLYGGQGAQIIQRAVACDNKYYYVAVRSYYASAGWGEWSTRIRGTTTSGKWIEGRDNALLGSTNAPPSADCNALTTSKTTSGSWQTGIYKEDFYVSYTKDTDYSNGSNTAVHGMKLESNGSVTFPSYLYAERAQISNPDSDTYYNAQSGDYSLSFGIGSGKVNRGIYDHTRGHWMLLNNATDTILQSTGYLELRANSSSGNPQIRFTNSANPGFFPTTDGKGYIGLGANKWNAVYATNGTIQTSDRNQKENILDIDPKYIELFSRLRPVTYEFKGADHDRVHIGFIAQEIKEAMDDIGITAEEFAGYCEDVKTEYDEEAGKDVEVLNDDGNPIKLYSLRYSEFIALNTAVIQKQQNKIDELESRLAKLEVLFGIE